jgi:hypothetical protein
LSLQIWKNFLAGTNRHINGFINGREGGSYLSMAGIGFRLNLTGNPTGEIIQAQKYCIFMARNHFREHTSDLTEPPRY